MRHRQLISLSNFRQHYLANIVKSHHAIDFFRESLHEITDGFYVFYIYRDPRAVMASFWRFLHGWEWHEGPRVRTCSDFIRAQPSGQLMRYQWSQKENMLIRWKDHVTGWLEAAGQNNRLIPVSYESLHQDYETPSRKLVTRWG